MDIKSNKLSTQFHEHKPFRYGRFIQGTPAMELNTQLGSILVVADLHIGFEGASTQNVSQSLLSQQVLDDLFILVKRIAPHILLICGDIKDAVVSPSHIISTMLWHSFNNLLAFCENIWIVKGNHDGIIERYLPPEIRLIPGTDVLFQTSNGSVGLCHGHASFSSRLASVNTLILGYSHPSIHIRDSFSNYTLLTWIRAAVSSFNIKQNNKNKINPYKGSQQLVKEIIILPPFNQFIRGFPLNVGGFIPGFIAERLIHPDNADLYLLDGSYLGSVSFCTKLTH